MENFDLLNESRGNRRTEVNNIINSSYHIYSHLMKFVGANYNSKSWADTVYNQSNQLRGITNAGFWREAEGRFEEVKRKAIKEYIDEKNPNADTAFGIVYQSFPNLYSLQSWPNLKAFMIDWCSKSNDKVSQDVIDHINRKG